MMSGEIEDKNVTWRVLDVPVYGTLTVPTDKDVHLFCSEATEAVNC
jgi:hypothetical protein